MASIVLLAAGVIRLIRLLMAGKVQPAVTEQSGAGLLALSLGEKRTR